MPLKRTLENTLLTWKANPNHKALLIDGARQVGKTYLIREFAKAHYKHVLEINFIEHPEAAAIFDGPLDAEALILGLTAYTQQPLEPSKTLVFLDEIQACPRARTAIKFLVDDARFDYIESGSLLGVTYEQPPSLPVGYEEIHTLYPLTFTEFCWAMGVQQSVLDEARAAFEEQRPTLPAVHEALTKRFLQYLICGGMPAAVQQLADTHDLAQVRIIQESIVALYRQDIARYAPNKAHIAAIFDAVPSELSKKNKRFKLANLAKSARMERYGNDFLWVVDAGVGLPCYNVTAPVQPLALNEQRGLFKLFLCDTGLLTSQFDPSIAYELLQGTTSINWGAVLENIAAQMLTAQGFGLRYFDKSKYGEIDFLVVQKGTVLPIEIKSGADYTTHKALNNVLSVEEWGIDEAYVFCRENYSAREVELAKQGHAATVHYFPWYMLEFLQPAYTIKPLLID